MEILCGLCRLKSHQLFFHLREVHAMDPVKDRDRCPGAPLVSKDLAGRLREQRVVAAEDGLRRTTDLFGVEFLGDRDESGLYTGTKVLNAAFLDRFASIYEIGYPEPAVERDVLQSRGPDCSAALARKMVLTACDVRKARESDEVYCTFSTRRLIELARKHVQLGDLSDALELALLNRLAPSDRRVVYEVCQRHMGDMMRGGADAE